MRLIVIIFQIFLCLSISLSAQNRLKKQASPNEEIKVNREYDEKGNLIRFDSIYSYSYSSDSSIMSILDSDKLNNFFTSKFNFRNDSIFLNNSIFDFFFNEKQNLDSLLKPKFRHIPDGFTHDIPFGSNDFFPDIEKFFDEKFRDKKDTSYFSPRFKNDKMFKQKSIEDMMKMLQNQMLEMEEYHRKYFKIE